MNAILLTIEKRTKKIPIKKKVYFVEQISSSKKLFKRGLFVFK